MNCLGPTCINTHIHTQRDLPAFSERPHWAGAGHWPLGRFNIYGSLQHFTVSAWQKWSASQTLCLSIQKLNTSHQLPSQSAPQDVIVMCCQDVTKRGLTRWAFPSKGKLLWNHKLKKGQKEAISKYLVGVCIYIRPSSPVQDHDFIPSLSGLRSQFI